MTATIAAADVDVTVKRADARWASRNGDEPASPDYLKHMADAVRPLLGQPGGQVDDVQVKQLLADKQRLGDLVDELRKHVDARDRTLDRQKSALEQVKAELAGANRAADSTALREKLAAAGADVERLTTLTNELENQVKARGSIIERRETELAQERGVIDELRRQLAAVEQPAPHHHRYPVDAPGSTPRPCECGQPYPRTAVVTAVVKPSAPEPWADLFGQIRDEAKKAGWKA
jgi:hypothetical protein